MAIDASGRVGSGGARVHDHGAAGSQRHQSNQNEQGREADQAGHVLLFAPAGPNLPWDE